MQDVLVCQKDTRFCKNHSLKMVTVPTSSISMLLVQQMLPVTWRRSIHINDHFAWVLISFCTQLWSNNVSEIDGNWARQEISVKNSWYHSENFVFWEKISEYFGKTFFNWNSLSQYAPGLGCGCTRVGFGRGHGWASKIPRGCINVYTETFNK